MRSDVALLLDMLLAAQNIRDFAAGMSEADFLENRMAQSAIIRELQVIGEAARIISDETRSQYPTIAWHRIAGMRNRLIHEYFDVRLDVVWNVVQTEIPALIAQITPLIPPE